MSKSRDDDQHSARHFTPAKREVYLETVRLYGKPDIAAKVAGVSMRMVKAARKDIEDFAEAEELAHRLRGQEIIKQLESEALNGFLEPMFDGKGQQLHVQDENGRLVPAMKRKVETALRLRMMERYDYAYKPRTNVDLTSKGKAIGQGALVVPQPVASVSEWAKLVASTKEPLAVVPVHSMEEEDE